MLLEQSPLEIVGCTREDCAGFAADAYARVHGMGALCVTYCVGGLSVCNSIAGAYAEKSPVVLITGSPGIRERLRSPLLHHMVRDFHTQCDVLSKLCCAGTELNNPLTAFSEIDRVLAECAQQKRPIYIDIPRDMVHIQPPLSPEYNCPSLTFDSRALNEAVDETARRIEVAKQPVIILGVEVHRFGVENDVVSLAESTGIPMAATMLSKGVVTETHPLYMGQYIGALSREEVTKYVEQSDCVLMIGTFMSDINLGIYTADLDSSDCILVTNGQVKIRRHHYQDVTLSDFVKALAARRPRPRSSPPKAPCGLCKQAFVLRPQEQVTVARVIDRLNEQLDDETVVITDVGDAMFAATELTTRGRTDFLSPAYYTSMGFAVPAALGVHMGKPKARVVAIVGDGAFQMTGMELSNLVRYHFGTIIIVLDNGIYGTEELLHPGNWRFNSILPWQYAKLAEVFGDCKGYEVCTEGEFDSALNDAWSRLNSPSIVHVRIDPLDCSQVLRRLTQRMKTTV